MKYKVKRGNKMKIRKTQKIGRIMIATLLISSLFSVFISPTQAGSPGEGMGWDDMTYEINIGETFVASVWGDATEFTGYTMWNLTWTAGKLNASHVTNGDSVTWGSWALTGGINNASGWILQIDCLTGDGTNVTGNYSLFDVTFVGKEVGRTDLTFIPAFGQAGIVLLDQAGLPIGGVYRNASVTIYPMQPATLTATKYNHTAVNLSFTSGTGGPNTTVCGKKDSYPTGPTDSVIYNGSLTKYNHTSLENCTTYYYRAWTWSETESMHSIDYQSALATTECYTNFTFMGVVPTNGTKRNNCTSYDVTVNLTINNSRGRNFYWYINGSEGSSQSGLAMANSSFDLSMAGLNHNQKYYWNVTATDATGTGDQLSANYEFITGIGGGTASVGGTIFPISGTTSLSPNFNLFSVDVTDADGDTMNVTFYWGNDTVIGTDNIVATGGTATITPTLGLNLSTRYFWYVTINDTCQETRAPVGAATYWFDTDDESVTITKDCMPSITNSSIRYIINVTNNGEANITDLVINETLDANVAFWKSNVVRNGDYWWNINYLNVSNTSSITIWTNVIASVNGTTISNSVNISNVTLGLMDTTTCGPYDVSIGIDKRIDGSLNWNSSWANFTINITNYGDIYLSGIQLNETYSANVSYYSSSIPADSTNKIFNISGLAPGATLTVHVVTNTSYGLTGEILVNQTRIYNNVTVRSNQTTPEVTDSVYQTIGAKTEQLKIWYNRDIPDLFSIGNQVFAILGAIMILGTLLILVYLVNKSGGIGGTSE